MTRWKRELEGSKRFHYAVTDRERYQRYRAFRDGHVRLSAFSYLNQILEIREDIGFYSEYPGNAYYDPKKFIPAAKASIRVFIGMSRECPVYPLPG